jgi:hypothetical protein
MNKRFLGLLALPLVALPVVACGPSHVQSDETKAKQTAAAADTQLEKDGYRPLHVPGFGKADVGFKVTGKGYELVYTAKDAQLVKTAVYEADQKHVQGVTFAANGNLAIVDADSLHQLKAGVTSLLTGMGGK